MEEVEDIFRAAPNQLLRQFVSVGAKGRARERGSHTSSTLEINMQPTRSLKAAAREREEEKVKERTGKRQDEAETDETTRAEETCFHFVIVVVSVM